jgi:hypothetical protein
LPRLEQVLDQLIAATFRAPAANAYEAEIARAVQRVTVEHLMTLAGGASMPQVRAIASHRLQRQLTALQAPQTSAAATAHGTLLGADIKRFLERPAPTATRSDIPEAPPGAPIGDPGMDWLRRLEPACNAWWWEEGR